MKVEIKVTAEMVGKAIELGAKTYADVKAFIAKEQKVELNIISYNEVKKVAKASGLEVGRKAKAPEAKAKEEPKEETLFLTEILAKYKLTRSTDKLEKELAEQGYTRHKTTTFPAKVFYTRPL